MYNNVDTLAKFLIDSQNSLYLMQIQTLEIKQIDANKVIRTFLIATKMVQFHYFLNSKFHASSHVV